MGCTGICRRALWTVLVLGLALSAPAARAAVLDFEDAAGWTTVLVPNGYGGLNWDNFRAASKSDAYPGGGFDHGTVSGQYAAFNGYGQPATVTAPAGQQFDFTGGYLTAGWNTGLQVQVDGWHEGTLLYTQTVTVDTTAATWFAFNYPGIDTLAFTSFGGVDANPNDHGDGPQFALDDFTFAGPQPLQTSPEPASLCLLLLGAVQLLRRRR